MNHVSSQGSSAKPSIVLVGIDFLALSKEILAYAAEVAVAAGGELHVVHVLPEGDVAAVQGERAIGVVNLAADARAKLEMLADDLPDTVARIFLHLAAGHADIEIVQLASDIGAELIVVGTRGRSGVDRLVDGSVAASLLRLAPCPVLVYRPKSVSTYEEILPPCPDCLEVQHASARARLWCERHSERHPRAHTYSSAPASYQMGRPPFAD